MQTIFFPVLFVHIFLHRLVLLCKVRQETQFHLSSPIKMLKSAYTKVHQRRHIGLNPVLTPLASLFTFVHFRSIRIKKNRTLLPPVGLCVKLF